MPELSVMSQNDLLSAAMLKTAWANEPIDADNTHSDRRPHPAGQTDKSDYMQPMP
jgi:hypothetical protein